MKGLSYIGRSMLHVDPCTEECIGWGIMKWVINWCFLTTLFFI